MLGSHDHWAVKFLILDFHTYCEMGHMIKDLFKEFFESTQPKLSALIKTWSTPWVWKTCISVYLSIILNLVIRTNRISWLEHVLFTALKRQFFISLKQVTCRLNFYLFLAFKAEQYLSQPSSFLVKYYLSGTRTDSVKIPIMFVLPEETT